uniref:Major facilitator superfamily (MFS) profile domain-containing protein n=1 Tax=Megaselia scalaris TaxID=36166 RepID=T1GE45_MEGSC
MADRIDKVPVLGIRHLQTALLFIAVFFANFTERNVPIALVAMTVENTSSNSDVETFDWSPRSKQLIISSFYWGYVVTLIPGGLLSKKFGSKLMLFISILTSTILSLITPIIISNAGWKGFCCIRVFQGLMQGMVIPIVMEHVTKWSPQSELTLHTSLSLSGVDCGTIAAMGLGVLLVGPIMDGQQSHTLQE